MATRRRNTPRHDLSNSGYWQSLLRALSVYGYEGEKRERAAKFFNPEWQIRSNVFWGLFQGNFRPGSLLTVTMQDHAAAEKFSGQTMTVAAIANNLRWDFGRALRLAVDWVANGVATRVEPFFTERGLSTFHVRVVMDLTTFRFRRELAETYSDDEVERFVKFFEPELRGRRVDLALEVLHRVSTVDFGHDEVDFDPLSPGVRSQKHVEDDVLRILRGQRHVSGFKVTPGGPMSIGQIHRAMRPPAESKVRATQAVFGLVAQGCPIHRHPPFYRHDACLLNLSIGHEKQVEVSDMSPEGAKSFFNRVLPPPVARNVELSDLPAEEAKRIIQAVKPEQQPSIHKAQGATAEEVWAWSNARPKEPPVSADVIRDAKKEVYLDLLKRLKNGDARDTVIDYGLATGFIKEADLADFSVNYSDGLKEIPEDARFAGMRVCVKATGSVYALADDLVNWRPV